jgi:DNA-binding NtrC family response regulator
MGMSVLVVHPERHIRRLVEVNLVRQGHRIRCVCDVTDALAAIGAEAPDIVIVDEERAWIGDALAESASRRCLRLVVLGRDPLEALR